ncbi:hypothetical protein MIMGU_mgv1a024416mg [Erythranthe guttata]|uniref:Fungal lipase-type domain-containing protein n=1 Tax=Erythranthe guttata TaxID=4155 RepID=A0A022RWI3_ERYGU|nr:hypothetical protein MIMGU_mgv1a024416mg [Erythranthe guttata]
MDPNAHTTDKYLLLKTREAGLIDMFLVLFSGDLKNKCFIEHNNVKEEIFRRRAAFSSSMFLQKALQKHEKCLSMIGSGFETCLNVFGNRSNLATFLKNLFKGNVVVPDRTTASFVSIVGHLDNRVELDKNIKPGTTKYFANLSAMASKLAYENKEFIRHVVEKIWKGETTQAFILLDKNTDTIIVAFRGTEPFTADDWCTDLDISGFMNALGLQLDRTWPENTTNTGDKHHHHHAYNTITETLKRYFKSTSNNYRPKQFILTGHSLGGALAALFPAVLAVHDETEMLGRLDAVYTFGQPRVGDAKFGRFMKEKFEQYSVKYRRFVYSHDIVPRVPFDDSALMFKHFGPCIYINTLYEAKVLEEEPWKNYFECGEFVNKRVDAMWEVVRGIVLPHMFGPEYKEGLLLLMFRMGGLVFPGLPAHGPQDYINATRLATY